VAGGGARVLMARHAGELRWLALMIEAINELSAGVDALGRGGRRLTLTITSHIDIVLACPRRLRLFSH